MSAAPTRRCGHQVSARTLLEPSTCACLATSVTRTPPRHRHTAPVLLRTIHSTNRRALPHSPRLFASLLEPATLNVAGLRSSGGPGSRRAPVARRGRERRPVRMPSLSRVCWVAANAHQLGVHQARHAHGGGWEAAVTGWHTLEHITAPTKTLQAGWWPRVRRPAPAVCARGARSLPHHDMQETSLSAQLREPARLRQTGPALRTRTVEHASLTQPAQQPARRAALTLQARLPARSHGDLLIRAARNRCYCAGCRVSRLDDLLRVLNEHKAACRLCMLPCYTRPVRPLGRQVFRCAL